MSDRTNGAGHASHPTVALVVPTRNEATHVEPFVERVQAALEPYPIDWRAEVIDDSEDDTAAVLGAIAGRGAPLEVTHRDGPHQAGGLGGAVRAGLARARADVVCVIDADLQHPPEILPELLAPIALGRADICIGSRYCPGGSAVGLNSRWRRLAARASRAAVRRLFPATRLTSDPGSGLFAMRRELLDAVTLRPSGSRVLAEILVRTTWQTVCDVPYRFEVTDDGDNHLGAAASLGLARELISLWRLDARADRGPRRRRVAPVHVDLLREPDAPLDAAERAVRSGEPA